jgi:hypothetical protein
MAALSNLTSRDAVLQAIKEYDELGREAFLKKYGFGPARSYYVVHDGKRYDSKAIAGVAYGLQHPGRGHLAGRDFVGGASTVQPVLEALGFDFDYGYQPGAVTRLPLASDESDNEPFDPTNAKDAREKVLREIRARRGQKQFRDALIDAYERRCAITGCDVLDVLEAAHITPYLGPETNDVTNGLLLRADLHTLVDTYLVAVDPKTLKVLVSPTIQDPMYRALHGQALRATKTKASAPSEAALRQHRTACRF